MTSIVFTWGKFFPAHIGHGKVIKIVQDTAKLNKCFYQIFTSTFDDGLNQEPHRKADFLRISLDGDIMIERTFSDVMKVLERFTHLIMVVGRDRVEEFQRILNAFCGETGQTFEVISAGERSGDSPIEKISSSKMREFVKSNDFDSFVQFSALSYSYSAYLFAELRKLPKYQ